MMWRFLKERRSWIAFVLFIEAAFLLITSIDPTIPFTSVLYAVFLTLLLFFLFLILRFGKETKFYRELEERENEL